VELQSQLATLREQGRSLAAISYDPPETLRAFADKHGITFPLLSDSGSAVIKRYGLLNTGAQPGTPAYGVPHPGTFVLNGRGEVMARFFEEAYQTRVTTASILARLQDGDAVPADAARFRANHLELAAYATDPVVSPGTRFSLVLDVTPAPKIHVYGPEQTEYIPIGLTLEPQPLLTYGALRFPPTEEYHFVPLDERVQVYQGRFRLVQDVTVSASAEARKRAEGGRTELAIAGTLRYQACDDTFCFIPEDVPVRWTVGLAPLR
jgi:hypothetical protein